MDFFLSLAEIRRLEDDIRSEFDYIFKKKIIVGHPNATQWQFVKHCFHILFDENHSFDCDVSQLKQYRHSANTKLKLRKKISTAPFIFSLTHTTKMPKLLKEDSYPSYENYALLVAYYGERHKKLELLQKTIADGIDLEYEVYKSLPTKDLNGQLLKLKKVFDEEGGSYTSILNTLENRNEKKHTITNKHNPSTKRFIKFDVTSFDNNIAEVFTEEYHYLKWYDKEKKEYTEDPYLIRSTQTYLLEWKNDGWMIIKDFRPQEREKGIILFFDSK